MVSFVGTVGRAYHTNPAKAKRALTKTKQWITSVRKYPEPKTTKVYENPDFRKYQDIYEKMIINENKGTLMSHGCTQDEANSMIEQAERNEGGMLDNRGVEFYGGSRDLVPRYTGRRYLAYVGSDKNPSGGQEGTGHMHLPGGIPPRLLRLEEVTNIDEINNFKKLSWLDLKESAIERFMQYFNEEVDTEAPIRERVVEDL